MERPGRATRVTRGFSLSAASSSCSSAWPTASRSSSTTHSGWLKASAAYRVGDARSSGVILSIHSSRSRSLTERSTALVKLPAPVFTRARTRSTVVLIAAWSGTRIDSSWWVPTRSASSTFDSTFDSGRSMQAARIAS